MDFAQVTRALLVCVDLITLLMLAIGGRVIPFFTGRKLPAPKMTQFAALNIAVDGGAAILLPWSCISGSHPHVKMPRGVTLHACRCRTLLTY